MSEFPQDIDQGHFDDLGTIDVLVMRCQAHLDDEANDSAVSSAAESDFLGEIAKPQGSDSTSDADEADGDNGEKATSGQKASAFQAHVADDDEADLGMGMMGIFDGPSDHYRDGPIRDGVRPMPGWQHPSGQPRHRYGQDAYGWSPRDYASAQYIPPGYDSTPPYRGTYPQHPPQIRTRKQVHFDHKGHDARDPREYHDTYDARSWGQEPLRPAMPGPSESQHDAYARWDDGDRYGDGAAYAEGYQGYDQGNGRYSDRPFHHQPPHYGHQYAPHPSAWPNGFPPLPGTGMPWLPQHPGHAPPWPHAYPTMPPLPHGPPQYPGHQPPVSWVPPQGSGPPAAPPAQPPDNSNKPGSLDPSRDQNNTQDDGWGNNGNNNDNQGGDGGWNDNGPDSSNQGGNDSWNDGGKNDNAATGQVDDWGAPGGTSNSGNAGSWQDEGANKLADTTWGNDNNTKNDSSAQQSWESGGASNTNNASTGWGNATTTAQPIGGDAWGTQAAGGAGDRTTASGSGSRPLYGPHGAYYDLKPSGDVECDAPEEPRYDVPQSVATKLGSTKQVQPGKGYLYVKKRCVPEYIDPLTEPYARFIFHYRTKGQLRTELNINLETEPSGNQEVQELQNMNKEELIQMFLRAKGALGGKIPSPPPVEEPKDHTKTPGPVPVEAPCYAFLDYQLPLGRGVAPNNDTTGNAGPTNGGDWGAPAADNTNGAKADASWETNNSGNNTGGNSGWDGGGNSGGPTVKWASGTSSNTPNDNTDWGAGNSNDEGGNDKWDTGQNDQSNWNNPSSGNDPTSNWNNEAHDGNTRGQRPSPPDQPSSKTGFTLSPASGRSSHAGSPQDVPYWGAPVPHYGWQGPSPHAPYQGSASRRLRPIHKTMLRALRKEVPRRKAPGHIEGKTVSFTGKTALRSWKDEATTIEVWLIGSFSWCAKC